MKTRTSHRATVGRLVLGVLAMAAPLTLAACANGPTLQATRANRTPIPPDRGRVYFYRTGSPIGAVIQPSVYLDETAVGYAVPGGVFFCDVAPGHHTASVHTEVDRSVSFDVAPGGSTYVKMDWGFGWLFARVDVEVVPPPTGARETAASSLVEPKCRI